MTRLLYFAHTQISNTIIPTYSNMEHLSYFFKVEASSTLYFCKSLSLRLYHLSATGFPLANENNEFKRLAIFSQLQGFSGLAATTSFGRLTSICNIGHLNVHIVYFSKALFILNQKSLIDK